MCCATLCLKLSGRRSPSSSGHTEVSPCGLINGINPIGIGVFACQVSLYHAPPPEVGESTVVGNPGRESVHPQCRDISHSVSELWGLPRAGSVATKTSLRGRLNQTSLTSGNNLIRPRETYLSFLVTCALPAPFHCTVQHSSCGGVAGPPGSVSVSPWRSKCADGSKHLGPLHMG